MTDHAGLIESRLAREWYPADTLTFGLAWHLCDAWEEKVEAAIKERVWSRDADIWRNDTGVYLTARDMARELRQFVTEFFAPNPDDPTESPLDITNHWANMKPLLA